MSKNIVIIPTIATPSTFFTEVKGTKHWKGMPQQTQSGPQPQKRACSDLQLCPSLRPKTKTPYICYGPLWCHPMYQSAL